MSIKGGTGRASGGGRISTSGEVGGSTTGGCNSFGASSILVGIGLGKQPREIFLTAAELQARPLYLKITPWILLACYEPIAAGCRQ